MHLFLWLVLMSVLFATINCNYSAFLSVSHSSGLSNLRESVGIPKFVARWSEMRMALGTTKLMAGVLSEVPEITYYYMKRV